MQEANIKAKMFHERMRDKLSHQRRIWTWIFRKEESKQIPRLLTSLKNWVHHASTLKFFLHVYLRLAHLVLSRMSCRRQILRVQT